MKASNASFSELALVELLEVSGGRQKLVDHGTLGPYFTVACDRSTTQDRLGEIRFDCKRTAFTGATESYSMYLTDDNQ